MAFVLGFTTTDADQGQTILVQDNSTDWSGQGETVVTVRLTIQSLYTGVDLTTSTVTKDITIAGAVTFEEGFEYEINAVDLFGASYDTSIPNSIYRITMTLYNVGGVISTSGYSYTSDEVYAYDAYAVRNTYISEKATYIDNVYAKDMDYANWLDFLIVSIEANTDYGNSSAIYYIFDIFKRLTS